MKVDRESAPTTNACTDFTYKQTCAVDRGLHHKFIERGVFKANFWP